MSSTVPLPSVPSTLPTVTAPPNSESEATVTSCDAHPDPVTLSESKFRTGPEALPWTDGPSVDAGVPYAMTRPEGRTTAAAPAPTQSGPSGEDRRSTYDGVVVVVEVVVVVDVVDVVSVVVVSVVVVEVSVVVVLVDVVAFPAAHATPTPSPEREAPTHRTPIHIAHRIATV